MVRAEAQGSGGAEGFSPLPPGSSAPQRLVEIAVRDTGVGIPAGAIPRILDRFYQVDSSTTRRHGGTGLGLALVKHILDAHGAPLAVESVEGRGTTFTVRLPAAERSSNG
jgi:two-component system phosphate regulon sensor histidine kinase PhoR